MACGLLVKFFWFIKLSKDSAELKNRQKQSQNIIELHISHKNPKYKEEKSLYPQNEKNLQKKSVENKSIYGNQKYFNDNEMQVKIKR